MEPKDIAYRSVAIALSDLAACGASPSWFMLSITLKDKSKDWLTSFRRGLIDVSDEFKIPLIGGDTICRLHPKNYAKNIKTYGHPRLQSRG